MKKPNLMTDKHKQTILHTQLTQVKAGNDSLLGLVLDLSSIANERKTILIASRGGNQFSSKFGEVIPTHELENPGSSFGWVMNESSIAMSGYKLTEIGVVCYNSKTNIDKRRLEYKTENSDDSSTQAPAEYYAVLGQISIRTSEHNTVFPPPVSWLVEGQYVTWSGESNGSKTLSVRISWTLKDGNDSAFPQYNIYAEKVANKLVGKPAGNLEAAQEFLGVARVKAFYVADLAVASGISKVKFIIQVCSVDGSIQKMDESPFLELDVEDSNLSA